MGSLGWESTYRTNMDTNCDPKRDHGVSRVGINIYCTHPHHGYQTVTLNGIQGSLGLESTFRTTMDTNCDPKWDQGVIRVGTDL